MKLLIAILLSSCISKLTPNVVYESNLSHRINNNQISTLENQNIFTFTNNVIYVERFTEGRPRVEVYKVEVVKCYENSCMYLLDDLQTLISIKDRTIIINNLLRDGSVDQTISTYYSKLTEL